MKASYQKIFYPLVLLLLVVAVAPAYAYPDFHSNTNGWNYGNFSQAKAYVSGWWWGTDYCNPPGYPFVHTHWWDIDDDYPYGKSVPFYDFGQCGYNTAWTTTTVNLQNAYGQWFKDSEACAAI